MNIQKFTKEEIHKILVGRWKGYWASANSTSILYYTFYADGKWDNSDSTNITVFNDSTVRDSSVVSMFANNKISHGTYYVTDSGELVLHYASGGEYRPHFEVGQWGSEIKIGAVWFSQY